MSQYLDIFGDWYSLKPPTNRDRRGLGIGNIHDFYDKYKIPVEGREGIVATFTEVFGVPYLFGDSFSIINTKQNKGVPVCRPNDTQTMVKYLKNRIGSLDIEIQSAPVDSVYKGRLQRIKMSIEAYVLLIEKSSKYVKVCEKVPALEALSDDDMLQYLAKVLYYGIYPEKAETNIRKCVVSFREMPNKGEVEKLIKVLKKKDSDKLLSFLEMVAVAVASLPKGESKMIAYIRQHLTEILQQIQPGASLPGNANVLRELRDALKMLPGGATLSGAPIKISDDFRGEMQKIINSRSNYPKEIKDILILLRDRRLDEFIAAVDAFRKAEEKPVMQPFVQEAKKHISAIRRDSDIVREVKRLLTLTPYINQALTRIGTARPENKRLHKEAKDIGIEMVSVAKAAEKEANAGIKTPDLSKKVTELETRIKVLQQNISEGEKEIKMLKDRIKRLLKLRNEKPEIEKKNPGIWTKFLGLIKRDPAKGEEALKKAEEDNDLSEENVANLHNFFEENEYGLTPEEEKEVEEELNELISGPDKNQTIRNLLTQLSIFIKMLNDTKNVECEDEDMKAHLDEVVAQLEKAKAEHAAEIEGLRKSKKEDYLDIIQTLVLNPFTRESITQQISNKMRKGNLNSTANIEDELGVPEDIKGQQVFMDILTKILFYEGTNISDNVINDIGAMTKDELKENIIVYAKLIMYLSSHLPEGINALEGMGLQEAVKLLEPEDSVDANEPGLSYIDIDNMYILIPNKTLVNDSNEKGQNMASADYIGQLQDTSHVFNSTNNSVEESQGLADKIKENIKEGGIYSRRQIVNVFITLLMSYYAQPEVNAGMEGNNNEEEFNETTIGSTSIPEALENKEIEGKPSVSQVEEISSAVKEEEGPITEIDSSLQPSITNVIEDKGSEVLKPISEARSRAEAINENTLKKHLEALQLQINANNKRKASRKNKKSFDPIQSSYIPPTAVVPEAVSAEPPARPKTRNLTRRTVKFNNNNTRPSIELTKLPIIARASQPSYSSLPIEARQIYTREERTIPESLQAAEEMQDIMGDDSVKKINQARINNLESKLHPLVHAKGKEVKQ